MVSRESFKQRIEQIKKDKFFNHSLVFFIGSFLASTGNYLFHFLMARMLSVTDYGQLQSLIATMAIFGIPIAVVVTVLVKYSAAFNAQGRKGKIYSLFFLFTKKTLLMAFVFFIVFCFLSKLIVDFLHLDSAGVIIILAIGFFPSFLASVNRAIIQGMGRFKTLSLVVVAEVFLKVLLAGFLVWLGWGVSGAVGAMVLAGMIGCVFTLLPLRFLFKEEKEALETKEIVQFFLPVFLTLLFTTLLYNLDIILVKHFLPAQLAGEYSALALTGRVVFFLGGPVVGVMFAMASASHTNHKRSHQILKKTIFLVVLLGLGVICFYFLFPELAIMILVGNKFLNLARFLAPFGLAMLMFSVINSLAQYFLSSHKRKGIYLLGVGVLLQIILISLWHDSLTQIVWAMNVTMLITLVLVGFYYFYSSNKQHA